MSLKASARLPSDTAVDIVIPVLNEAHVLEKSVTSVRTYLQDHFTYRWRVVVIDNGSTDGTQAVAKTLSIRFSDVKFMHLVQRGRGRALRAAWLQSSADVVCYMDVDLSTDLKHLRQLIDAIVLDGYDIAVGSRLMRESKTKRCFKRDVISRIYNMIIKGLLFTRFSDAQCGFKAISRQAVKEIVPQIEDQSWFFDTEMLVIAEKQGYRIKDIPIFWIEDDDSRVKILKTGWEDIKGLLRLRTMLWKRSFAGASAVTANRESLRK